MATRAESAPAGRPDYAPLGRQHKTIDGDNRPIPLRPKETVRASSTASDSALIRSGRREEMAPSTKPPLQHHHNSRGHDKTRKVKKPSKRTLQCDPLADRCSIALSRTESILVSAAGDVLVCRCRRSSTPYMATTSQDSINPMFMNLIPCCDTDCGGTLTSAIEGGPWSPVFDSLTVKRQISSGEMSQNSETSTFEWETPIVNQVKSTLSGVNGSPSRGSHRSSRSLPNNLVRRVGSLTINTSTTPPDDDKDEVADQIEDDGDDNNNNSSQDEAEKKDDDDTMEFSPSNLSAAGQLSPGILPLPSFDYSHIHEGHNDMLQPSLNKPGMKRKKSQTKFPTIMESPEEKKEELNSETEDKQPFLHGVPVFLTQLSQIRVRVVSAHPLGAHVLLISEEALLFTYGLNNHGQLGIGVRSHIKDENRGFHTAPTLVTPLLENGGKTILCAAGVDHSLVVVATEGRRLHKFSKPSSKYGSLGGGGGSFSELGALSLSRVTSQPVHVECVDDDDAEADSVRHHQVYGFGCNEFMKIGLFSAMKNHFEEQQRDDDDYENSKRNKNAPTTDVEDDILLPHRVALHCSVWPSQNEVSPHFPPHGIFEIAASAEHSAALVRRPTGDIEVYTWGNATLGALGIPINNVDSLDRSSNRGRRESSSSAASPGPTNNVFPIPTVVESLSYRSHKPMSAFPRGLSLGPYSSFVLMSNGKCMSFGYSAVGMLGHGYGATHSMKPKEVFLPNQGFVSVSAGAFHVVGVAENGQAYTWGINADDRLGLGTGELVKVAQQKKSRHDSSSGGVSIEWVPQHVEFNGSSKNGSGSAIQVIRACAGYDCSMLVTRSGEVYSFGKRSGKLGKGELVADVGVPEPLYGGLRLFHNLASAEAQENKKKAALRRMDSETNLHLHNDLKYQQDV